MTASDPTPEPDDHTSTSCGYEGRHFGSRYPDAVCIDGHLWDLDSGDGDGYLSHGGDLACPQCNLTDVFASLAEDVYHLSLNDGKEPFVRINEFLLGSHMRALHGTQAFVRYGLEGHMNVLWFGGHGQDADLGARSEEDPKGRIAWPWPIADALFTSTHERISLLHALRTLTPPEGFARTDGMLLGPVGPDDW